MLSLTDSVGKGAVNVREDALLVQSLLNRFRPSDAALIRIDGAVGPQTLSAIVDFQRRVMRMISPDGVISPGGPTFKALCGGDTDGLKIAWGAKVDPEFKQKAISICSSLQIPVDFLMSAMAFESGESFSPSIRNAAGSGAVGLIQFMPTTARALGTSVENLIAMSAVQQLDFVQKYFSPHRGKLCSLEDVYMAILFPAAIGKSPGATLFASPSIQYQQNSGLDVNHDGIVTVQEAASRVRAKFIKGLQPGCIG